MERQILHLDVELHKEACQDFGKYLDGKRHGRNDSARGLKRSNEVQFSFQEFGDDSLLNQFKTEYTQGYVIVVQALKVLERNKINTVSEFLNVNLNHAVLHMPGCGKKVFRVFKHMQLVAQTAKNLRD